MGWTTSSHVSDITNKWILHVLVLITLLSFNFTDSANATSSEFEVVTVDQEIFLVGPDQDEILRELKQLSLWGASHQKPLCSPIANKDPKSGLWKVNIQSCLPEHVLELNMKAPFYDGPNCYNLVLNFQKVTLGLLDSPSTELEAYLKSPLCQKKSKSDLPQTNDLGLIKDGTGYIHGFVYGTDQIAYTKNGVTSENPYKLQNVEALKTFYKVGIKSRDDNESECYKSNEPECQVVISLENYKCESFETLKTIKLSPYSTTLLLWHQKISKLEALFKNYFFILPRDLNSKKIQLELSSVAENLLKELKSAPPLKFQAQDKYDEFLKKALIAKTDNLSYSASLPPVNDHSSEVYYKLSAKLNDYLGESQEF